MATVRVYKLKPIRWWHTKKRKRYLTIYNLKQNLYEKRLPTVIDILQAYYEEKTPKEVIYRHSPILYSYTLKKDKE